MSTRAELIETGLAGAIWRKSSYTANSGNRVEVARMPGGCGVAIRDTKNKSVAVTRATDPAWGAFLAAVTDGSLCE
jgi:hypothetical protein